MLAIEFVEERDRKTPATMLAGRVVERARERRLLLLTCGPHKNVVRILAPLVATMDEIDTGISRLESALHDAIVDSKACPGN
jgi:4-aminobutyrate aminotransferase/(S)-3-amino-2-methylpropionate transaminase